MKSNKAQIIGFSAFAAALLAVIVVFLRVFTPEPFEPSVRPDEKSDHSAVASSLAHDAVGARYAQLAAFGSRATGQEGAVQTAAAVESAFREAGLEVFDQDVDFATVVTDGGNGTLSVEGSEEAIPAWPLGPNYVQPVATPAGGVSGDLFEVSDGSLAAAEAFTDKIAVIDLSKPPPNEFRVNPGAYCDLGFQAVVYTHSGGLEKISPDDLRKMSFTGIPANVVRVVADPLVLDSLGAPATLKVNSRWVEARSRNVIGIMRAPGSAAESALVIPVYYDSPSLLPDHAPGSHQTLQTAIMLQLMEGLSANRGSQRRDVVFAALSGAGASQIGAARLLSVVGRAGEADLEGERLKAETAVNNKALAEITEILALFEDPGFATPDGAQNSADAVDALSEGAGALFRTQFNYVLRLRVFDYAETLLQAEIKFQEDPDNLKSPEFADFRAKKQHYDELNTLSALPFRRFLERPQAGDGGYIATPEELAIDPEASNNLRHALRAHFGMLAAHHERRADSLARDSKLQQRLSGYHDYIVIAPELNPSATNPEQETLAFTSGTEIAHASAAQTFHRMLEDSVHSLGLQNRLTLRPPARTSSFSAELSRQSTRLAATPWAVFSHPAFSVISPMNAYANVGDLPHENPAATNLASIASSLQVLGEAAAATAEGAGRFQRIPIQEEYSFHGKVLAAGVGNSIVPNFPVAGALVYSANKPPLLTDPYGVFSASHLVFPQSKWQRPQQSFAFYFNKDGVISHVKDTGSSAQLIYKSTETLFDAPNNLILYRAAPVAILDAVNPQSMKNFTASSFIQPRGLSEFKSKSPYVDTFGMMDFIEPRERFFVTLRAGSPENELVSVIRAFALGTTQTNWIGFKPNRDSEIDGAGYVAQDTPVLREIARESSASMIDLAEKRLDLQRRYGMADDMTLTFHERAKELAHQAGTMEAPALDRRQIFRSSLSYLILNHPVIHKSITDAVWGILWYMALLVPFMFFFEKLVFGFTDIRKQLLAEAGIFLTVFILLRMLHPAFQIVRSSIMILLGFVIIFIAGSATILLSAKFKENIDALRAAKGEVQNAEGNKMGMMTTAFMLGLNNMHKRKVRTGLTCASLVLMTFVMISFSSAQSNIVNRNRAIGKAEYQGILVREPRFTPVTDGEINALKARYGRRFQVNIRRVLPGIYDPSANKGTPSPLAITAGSGGAAITRSAKTALLFDATEPIAPSIPMLTTNGWFTTAQQENKSGPLPLIISDVMAQRLGITVPDVNSGPVDVALNGAPFFIHGIFDSRGFAEVRDVDGENLLPFDIEALVSPRVVNSNIVLAESDDPRVPAEDAIFALNGHIEPADAAAIRIMSAVVDMNSADYPTARREIDAHLEQTSRQTYYGLDGVGYIARRARVSSLAGLMDLIIPLVIAGLTVLNTMKGSVYERRDEIFVYNAVGISPRNIFFMFVAESLVYAVVGVVLGYVLAQGTGRVLTALDLTGGLNMNFTSLSTVYASLAIAAVTILSTWFPARQAMEIAKPSEDAGWTMPKTEGDELSFDLPFTFTHYDRIAVLGFFHRYFINNGEGSAGAFFAGVPRLAAAVPDRSAQEHEERRGGDDIVPYVEVTVWCKPFDLGVSQLIRIELVTDPATGEYVSHMKMRRLTGTHDAWQRLNTPLVRKIREHFLHWRAATDDMKEDFHTQAKALLEASATTDIEDPQGVTNG